MLNVVVVSGRLTSDPELRYTQSGIPVAVWSLAVEGDAREHGEKQVDYIDCCAWRKTAEFVAKWFKKGKGMQVKGRLHSRKWQGDDGKTRKDMQVTVETAYFFGGPRKDEETALPDATNQDYERPPIEEDIGEDDLPF